MNSEVGMESRADDKCGAVFYNSARKKRWNKLHARLDLIIEIKKKGGCWDVLGVTDRT
jgi:hypothetical protein